MKALVRGVAAIGIAFGINAAAGSQMPAMAAASVEALDPAMTQLISPAAKVDILKNEFFGDVEGPVWVREGKNGYLLFSDMAENCIYKWEKGKLSWVFLEKSGFTGTDLTTVGVRKPPTAASTSSFLGSKTVLRLIRKAGLLLRSIQRDRSTRATLRKTVLR